MTKLITVSIESDDVRSGEYVVNVWNSIDLIPVANGRGSLEAALAFVNEWTRKLLTGSQSTA